MSQTPLLYDWSGRPVSAAAAPITGRPGTALSAPQGGAMMLGSDYATAPAAQMPHVDGQGNLYAITMDAIPQTSNAPNILRQALVNGTNTSLLVNGSTTNVTFSWSAPSATASYIVTSIHVVMVAATLNFAGKYFGAAAALAHGLLLQMSLGGAYTPLATIALNEDLLAFNGPVDPTLSGSTDVLSAKISLAHPIQAGSGDAVQVIVRDNLTVTNMPTYLRVFVEGVRLTS